MPIWILILLIPIGTPNLYISEVIDTYSNETDCIRAMNRQDNLDQYVCVEIE